MIVSCNCEEVIFMANSTEALMVYAPPGETVEIESTEEQEEAEEPEVTDENLGEGGDVWNTDMPAY
jgi:hypothetical protein